MIPLSFIHGLNPLSAFSRDDERVVESRAILTGPMEISTVLAALKEVVFTRVRVRGTVLE